MLDDKILRVALIHKNVQTLNPSRFQLYGTLLSTIVYFTILYQVY